MDVTTYIDHVEAEGKKFASAAEQCDLNTPVAACDGWNTRTLVRHLGLIHLWAAATVANPNDDWLDADDIGAIAKYWPDLGGSWPADTELADWYRRTNENLVDVLRGVPADHQCFSFLPAPTPITMWARRQASETAIHRVDIEQTLGIDSGFEPDFAADMLDELLVAFANRERASEADFTEERTLAVHAHDVDQHWHLTITPTVITTTRAPADADLTLSATAAELYVTMWNRAEPSTAQLTGDPAVLDLWRENCRIRWSGGE